ncbi:MAG TPA: endo-1,4-beta-xylanase [Oceanobacillus sp.]|nr:endo-1,4-beta-xylanase [Oceanobacillus sp.]
MFRTIWILAIALLLGAGLSAAQDEQPSLRELAESRDFYIGAAVWTNHLDVPEHAETLAREFNMLTPEHEAKHCMVERQRGQYDFEATDRLVEFAEEHDMVVHGHTLVWHQCMPQWLVSGDFTRDEAIEIMRDFIFAMVERYKGRIAIWDVVNEAVADSGRGLRRTPWLELIGEDYIELAFRFAHEADPDALLFYNDYGAEAMTGKANGVYELLSDLLERGVPVHGVGLQGHFTLGSVNAGSIAQNIQRLGELGLQVQITEMDVRFNGEPNDNILHQQATDYERMMEVCLESEYCTAFVVWGVSDRFTWLRGSNLGFFENPDVAPLLFDDDYNPKPAYFALLDLLAEETQG